MGVGTTLGNISAQRKVTIDSFAKNVKPYAPISRIESMVEAARPVDESEQSMRDFKVVKDIAAFMLRRGDILEELE